MPAVQQQAPNLAGAYSVCGQASLPRAGVDEHNRSDVHQPLGGVGAVISSFPHIHHHNHDNSHLFFFAFAASSGLQDGLFSSLLHYLHTLQQAIGDENSQHVRDSWAWTFGV